jgi:hypothetical protein
MKTMNHTERTIVETYSVFFDNLSDTCKTALMEYLSDTMKSSKKSQKTENGFALSFGKWEGTEQSTEEIKVDGGSKKITTKSHKLHKVKKTW